MAFIDCIKCFLSLKMNLHREKLFRNKKAQSMLKGVNLGTAVGYGLCQPYFQDINIQGARVKNTI